MILNYILTAIPARIILQIPDLKATLQLHKPQADGVLAAAIQMRILHKAEVTAITSSVPG